MDRLGVLVLAPTKDNSNKAIKILYSRPSSTGCDILRIIALGSECDCLREEGVDCDVH